jgi:hypothetical protein
VLSLETFKSDQEVQSHLNQVDFTLEAAIHPDQLLDL